MAEDGGREILKVRGVIGFGDRDSDGHWHSGLSHKQIQATQQSH